METVIGSVRKTRMNRESAIGKHLIADFTGASYQTDQRKIEHALRTAAQTAGATVLDVVVHSFPDGGGLTGVAILAESHITIHTWPEHDYIAFDIFMCGDSNPELALEWLKLFFKPVRISSTLIERTAPE